MSETEKIGSANEAKLNGLFAFKKGMATVYNKEGEMVPVTVLEVKPWVVSQIKTKEKDGYTAVQIAHGTRRASQAKSAQVARLKDAGFENGARLVREIRQDIPEGLAVGQRVALDSLTAGDLVKLTSNSKGHGFAGVVKRWNFSGGPAAHGSKFHRRPGSMGNRTWPARVMPGKKLPGHFGDERVTLPRVQVVEVIPEENVILVKGPVPGGTNTLVQLMKV